MRIVQVVQGFPPESLGGTETYARSFPASSSASSLARTLYILSRKEVFHPVFDRITFDPRIIGGRACIRGMRIPVSVVVGQIAYGATADEVLTEYPDLEQEDVEQALAYAAWLTQEEVHPG
jgi:uncharacterized protein (DUF433 family)